MLAEEDGLDDMPRQGLCHDEQCGSCQHHGPTRIDRRSQCNREAGGDNRTDERHEAHETGEDPPQHGVRYADQPEPCANDHTEACVENGLHQEKAAQACGRIIESCCASLQVGGTG
jgi:hypothetical protein